MTASLTGPVLVVGCGLMGTSVGLALRRRGIEVYLDDVRRSHVEVAESRGAGSGERAPTSVTMVVVAVPPDHVGEAVVAALRDWPSAVVTDLSSIKAAPLAVVRSADVDASRYVGGHPMAGSERSGPVAASEQLFDGRAWAVTPAPEADPRTVEQVRTLATTCGATVVDGLSPDEHDEAVARVSHLPHVMSVLAAAQLDGGPADHLALAGQGLRDVTRIAGGDPRLWQQILGGNAEHLGRMLRAVRADIDTLLDGLQTSSDSVAKVLERGVHGTDLIPGKHGTDLPAESIVYVQLPDRPGELARLFGDAGESGVNIEDLRIDHDPARPVGLVEVVVASDRADVLIDALVNRGWRAHR